MLMGAMPESRALLGVDVIASASSPGHYRDRQWGALTAMLGTALASSGITPDAVVHFEPTGDGALYTFPSRCLGMVIDLSECLDKAAAEHNRWCKPDIRLRLSVEIGAVGDGPGYYSPKIYLNRMLGARAFKSLINECIRTTVDPLGNGSVNTGLIVSGPAFREAFGGNYTRLVRQTDFARLSVVEKEFSDNAWIRVPGLDNRTLAGLVASAEVASGDATTDRVANGSVQVTNHVGGNMTDSVQAGVVNGGIYLGRGHR
jgi:hypothetical protein